MEYIRMPQQALKNYEEFIELFFKTFTNKSGNRNGSYYNSYK